MAKLHLKKIVKDFLTRKYNNKSSVLLALSGGPDSLLLFSILVELKDVLSLKFAVAHVDHRWRETSDQEAQNIKDLVTSFDIPFHLRVLDPTTLSGNLENACRKERLNFFEDLCKEHNYQAVLLGHHADDQAETVLKRLFEGAGLTALGGLKECVKIGNIALWRPLLKVSKQEILTELNLRSLIPIDDSTNRDNRYTRAKFRNQIIPALSNEFGKEITPSLVRLGVQADSFSDYLDKQIENKLSEVILGPFGAMLDLQMLPPIHPVELKHLVLRFSQYMDQMLSYQEIDAIVEFLQTNQADKQLRSQDSLIQVDRKRLFFLNQPLRPTFQKQLVSKGISSNKEWDIDAHELIIDDKMAQSTVSDWLSVWKCSLQVILPKGDYYLDHVRPNSLYPGNSRISKWWSDAKVPAFLRNAFPVVWHKDTIVHEFLTGRRKSALFVGAEGIQIKLVLKTNRDSGKIN